MTYVIFYLYLVNLSAKLAAASNSIDYLRHCFADKNIVMVGDSLTRYQYLNLANALHSGDWRMAKPSMVAEGEWGDWKRFHLGTNLRLGCNEICDCYRDPDLMYKENRFYHDSVWNITLSTFFWAALMPLKIYKVPTKEDILQRCASWEGLYNSFANYAPLSTSTWRNISEFIVNIVAPMQPDILVFNQGIWAYDELRLPENIAALSRACFRAAKRVIWRTTTARQNVVSPIDDDQFVALLKKNHFEIFDAYALTKKYSGKPEHYFDHLHFQNSVYSEMMPALVPSRRRRCRSEQNQVTREKK